MITGLPQAARGPPYPDGRSGSEGGPDPVQGGLEPLRFLGRILLFREKLQLPGGRDKTVADQI